MDIEKMEQLLSLCQPVDISPLSDQDLDDYAAGKFKDTQRLTISKAWGELSCLLWANAPALIAAAKREREMRALLERVMEFDEGEDCYEYLQLREDIKEVMK